VKRRALSSNSFGLSVALFSILLSATTALGQTTSFTYQGRLTDGGTAANGNYDLQFALWDSASGGTQVGSTLTVSTVAVSNGGFSVSLDFGAGSFNGANRFLEISARPVSAGAFTLLSPRQQVTATPYAIRSANTSLADNATTAATATNATQLGGVAASQYVQTSDSRLSDARAPAAGSANYIQNTTNQQAGVNFNISGNGTIGGILSGNVVNAATQFNIGGNPVLSVTGSVGTFANSNTFAGVGAGAANTPHIGDGVDNSFFGQLAGNKNTIGFDNAFFGANAGQNNTGSGNAFFGSSAGVSNTSGVSNDFYGTAAGASNTTGTGNAFFGHIVGASSTTGNENALFGFSAGSGNTTGSYNSFFGRGAGNNNVTGNSNTMIGYLANLNVSNLTNATAIGAYAVVSENNSLVLGSINSVNSATADTNVGIGTTEPTKRLDVGTTAVGDGINLFGVAPAYFLSDGSNNFSGNEKSALGLAGSAGLYSTNALAGDVVLRATTNRLILQHGNGGAGIILNAAGNVQVQNLASGGGSTQLCRNLSNEITNCNSSSLRYKTNIATFRSGLDVVNRLRPISFSWKQDGTNDIGFGAEEVEKVAPLFTFRNDKGEIEGVRYDRLSVLFVNAFKEQQTQIETQEQQIKRQQALMSEQQAALAAQQKQLTAFKKLVCRSRRNARVCRTS
jgi:hypothetical protein